MNDHYNEKEQQVIDKLNPYGFNRLGDNVFEVPPKLKEKDIRDFLLDNGFVEDKDFSTFLNS